MKGRRWLVDDAQHDVAASAAHERTCHRQACRLCAAEPPWAHLCGSSPKELMNRRPSPWTRLRGSSPKVPMTRRPPPWTRLRGCSSVVALARVWLQSRSSFRQAPSRWRQQFLGLLGSSLAILELYWARTTQSRPTTPLRMRFVADSMTYNI